MRIAVLSDIHGFSLAFQTVLDDLDAQGPFDDVVVAGDLCEVGPAPAEVIDMLRDRSFTVLIGNTDVDIVEAAQANSGRGSVKYAIDQIGPDGVEYLAELPFSRRIEPPGGSSPSDDLLVVHANPRDLYARITPEMSDRELSERVGGAQAGAIAFGHYHVCFTRWFGQTLLVDVSAVGNPKDGDLRCKYGVLTWNEAAGKWSAELRKLPYPLEATETQIRASSIPAPENVIAKVKRASYA